MAKKPSAEILEVDPHEVERMLGRAAARLSAEDAELVRRIVQSYAYISDLVEDKNTTIARLRQLFFGSKTEKSDQVLGKSDDGSDSPPEGQADGGEPSDSDDSGPDGGRRPEPSSESEPEKEPAPGHGRYGADDYSGAQQVDVKHSEYQAGDDCPSCGQGTLYEKKPSVLVRFVGQAPLSATAYRMQRLRCHTCGKVFTAETPQEAGQTKYGHSVASMIGLLKYGSGFPFNRLQRLQGNCEIPLAASTQWEIVSSAAELFRPAWRELLRQAADGEVVYNDDTAARILELMGERFRKSPPADDEHDPGRTGLFTSGVVSTRTEEGRKIRMALFFSGRKHAGENLADVIRHRAAELDAPVHMCDGLSRNLPRELETIVANCLSHGRRKFVELHDRFPEECRYVIKAFKVIYFNDKVAREEHMSGQERLSYHQKHSQKTMDDLNAWLERQFKEKLAEPNSALGEAIAYLLKRWDRLTLFLRKAGAPLDNNLCERALKKAIMNRKNAYFYKTRRGALTGDMYMGLIHTCELNDINPLDYLNELQLNASDVASHPGRWMPWNYQATLAAAPNAA